MAINLYNKILVEQYYQNNIPELFGRIFSRAFIPRNITSGFLTTGIYPYNKHAFDENDVTGSEVKQGTM